MSENNSEISEFYNANGYYTPIDILTKNELQEVLNNFDTYKKQFSTTGKVEGDYRFKSHLLTRWAWNLIHHPKILKVVAEVLNTKNVLCWSTDFNIKDSCSSGYFTWHQDSTYCGLTPAQKILTAWIALTPSNRNSGCVCFLPKTHTKQLHHTLNPQQDNMLALGQEVANNFVEEYMPVKINAELQPGQMSLHHSFMVHGSGPNNSHAPRVGFAIRYMSANVKKEAFYPSKERVTLVSGCKQHDGFEYEHPPVKDFSKEAYQEHQISMSVEKENYFFGKIQQGFK